MTDTGAGAGASGGALRFSGPAANALELAVTEAISLGHNYVGCEHLLLGLATETEGTGGAALRDLGADSRPVRRAITAALAGYTAINASKQARVQAASQANQPGQPGAGQMLTMLARSGAAGVAAVRRAAGKAGGASGARRGPALGDTPVSLSPGVARVP